MKRSNVFMLVVFLVFHLLSLPREGRCEEYVVLSLSRLQDALSSSAVGSSLSLPLGEVMGLITDDSGDMMLIAARPTGPALTVDDITFALRSVFLPGQEAAVAAIEGLTMEGSDVELFYYGGVEGTSVGSYMAESLVKLDLLSEGVVEVPRGYWHYPEGEKTSLKLTPGLGEWITSRNHQVMVMNSLGIDLSPDEISEEDVSSYVRDWISQVLNRYREIESIHQELFQLRNFFRIVSLVEMARGRTTESRWEYFLRDYRPTDRLTPGTLARGESGGVLGDKVSSKVDKKKILFRSDPLMDDLKAKAIALFDDESRAPYREFDFPLGQLVDTGQRLARVTSRLKEVDLYEHGVFLGAKLQNTPPSVQLLAGEACFAQSTAASMEFKNLVEMTVNGAGNIDEGWERFYTRYLSPLVKDFAGHKSVLVILCDRETSQWVNFDRASPLVDRFHLFMVPVETVDFLTSILDFLNEYDRIPEINTENVGLILSIDEHEVIRQLDILTKLIGEDRILLNPTIAEFRDFFSKEEIRILFLDVEIKGGELQLRDGSLSPNDLLYLKRCPHIDYLSTGYFRRGNQSPWERSILKSLQTKGVGIIGVVRDAAPNDVLFRRIEELRDLIEKEPGAGSILDILRFGREESAVTFWADIP